MNIIYFSDAAIEGSGYQAIGINLCMGLSKDHNVFYIGLNYKGEENSFPFTILPCGTFQEAIGIYHNLCAVLDQDLVIVAMDIPLQRKIMTDMMSHKKLPYIGIMPLESDPLCFSWAASLMGMNKALFISEFGASEAKKQGVDAVHIPIGIDTKSWRFPTKEEKVKLRDTFFGIDDDTFVILTVAANQERKNISASMQMVSEFKKKVTKKFKYVLVTKEKSPAGWELRDLAKTLGISRDLLIFETGLPFKSLWGVYAASDCFLIASKGEGLCCLPGTRVWSEHGNVDITSLNVGDLVISHTGKLREVEEVYSRNYCGNSYSLVMPYGLDSINLTPDHLVFSTKRNDSGTGVDRLSSLVPSWNKVQNLKKGDFVWFPVSDKIKINDIYPSHDVSGFLESGDMVYPIGSNQVCSYPDVRAKGIPKKIKITKDLMRLFGFYLSEGCTCRGDVIFSFHHKEFDYYSDVIKIISSIFGDSRYSEKYDTRNRYSLRYSFKSLSMLLSGLFGKSSHEKSIPSWMLFLDNDLLWELVKGMMFGDGYLSENNQIILEYSTVSEKLAEQLQFILSRLGILSTLKRKNTRVEYKVVVHKADLHKVPFLNFSDESMTTKNSSRSIKLDDGFMIPIKDVIEMDYSGIVYNLEVNTDNSYLTGGGAVHNCYPILESMATGLPFIGTKTGAIPEHCEGGRGFLVDYKFVSIDPYGNSNRYYADVDSGLQQLEKVYHGGVDVEAAVTKARSYVEARTWENSVEVLNNAISEVLSGKAKQGAVTEESEITWGA